MPRRVRRSERRGLRRLRAIARSGGCVAGAGAPVTGTASSGPFEPIAGVVLFESGASQRSGDASTREGSDARGDVLGTRRASPPIPRLAQLSPLGPLDDAEGDGPALAILAALLAATLALGVLAFRLGRRGTTPEGPSAPPAERDPREWEPPPPPWSRD